jgi:hypothetical protein
MTSVLARQILSASRCLTGVQKLAHDELSIERELVWIRCAAPCASAPHQLRWGMRVVRLWVGEGGAKRKMQTECAAQVCRYTFRMALHLMGFYLEFSRDAKLDAPGRTQYGSFDDQSQSHVLVSHWASKARCGIPFVQRQ